MSASRQGNGTNCRWAAYYWGNEYYSDRRTGSPKTAPIVAGCNRPGAAVTGQGCTDGCAGGYSFRNVWRTLGRVGGSRVVGVLQPGASGGTLGSCPPDDCRAGRDITHDRQ